MLISFWIARAQLILDCVCTSYFGMCRRISFWIAHAHLILDCACTSHFGLRVRNLFWTALAYLIFVCTCALNLGMGMHPYKVFFSHTKLTSVIATAHKINHTLLFAKH